jgi:transposase
MRTTGSPIDLERRRQLAVERVLDGHTQQFVADFLGVGKASVSRWMDAFHRHGWRGLKAQPPCGRPSKLTYTQEKIVLRWLRANPVEFGFPTELWTAKRLALLIRMAFEIDMNANYLSSWMRARNFTPQIPDRVPRERNPERIAAWVKKDWPRIKKKRQGRGQTSRLSMKADS